MDAYPGYAVHQISPYLGKLRPSLARGLILSYSKVGDLIWDPFCGSGTVPYECGLLSRHSVAADINPYACALTKAKLHAPSNKDASMHQLYLASKALRGTKKGSSLPVPNWVQRFFHRQTLREALVLTREFGAMRQYFNLGCLLGILHHQRPGFLSYPASHLVPYLRDHLYPREQYPEAYEYRDPIPRLEAKITRVLNFPPPPRRSKYTVLRKSVFERYLAPGSVDGVITSPPYMDALDYARDNRLRLWFLGVDDYAKIEAKEIRRIRTFEMEVMPVLRMLARALR